jgi:hypothetical protein
MDNWVAPVPGYDEVKAFYRKMGEKMGYLYGSGMSQLAAAQPQMASGMAEAWKEMSKLDGMPVQSVIKIGSSAAGGQPIDATQTTQQPKAPSGSDVAGAAAGGAAQSQANRLPGGLGSVVGGFGGFGRKKSQPQAAPAPAASTDASPATADAGSLIEMTTELSSYSSGAVETSKFDVPAGFKQVDSTLKRGKR